MRSIQYISVSKHPSKDSHNFHTKYIVNGYRVTLETGPKLDWTRDNQDF